MKRDSLAGRKGRVIARTSSDPTDVLRAVFCALADIPDVEWRFFRAHIRERQFRPREHLVREGLTHSHLFYVVSGLVRNYHNDEDGELVRGFDFEGRFAGVYECALAAAPSTMSVQALERTHTLAFPGVVMAQLYDRHPCWDRVGRKLLEEQWTRRQDKEMRFRSYTAEEHYRLLIQRRSPLIERVPLRHLASYMRITPETLSRIRARLRGNGENDPIS